jgi:YHS domain-containing protein
MTQFLTGVLFATLCLFGVLPTSIAAEPDGTRVALRGYDPVAYFTQGQPTKGTAEFTAKYDNTIYWFASVDHRAKFVADPERYAPQFDGLCAIDMSRGLRTEPDPEAWTISDGKLYVFGKKRGPSLFAEQSAEILAQARKNWAGTS